MDQIYPASWLITSRKVHEPSAARAPRIAVGTSWTYLILPWQTRELPSYAHEARRDDPRLLHRCCGDAGQAERLIHDKLARRPGQSRAAASGAALDRWARDR